MNRIEKIDKELEKARDKAAEWAGKVRELEKQRQEEENSQIVQAVRSMKLTPEALAVFLSNPANLSVPSGQVGPKSTDTDEKEDEPDEE